MRYEFATAGQIIVGPGSAAELTRQMESLGRRALVVLGRATMARSGPAAAVVEDLERAGLLVAHYVVGAEPDVALVEGGVQVAREVQCDLVIGLGGGSVLDTAKAIAGLATNEGDALTYMEVVGAGAPLQRPALPIIAVPTTAGTGSEVTRNAVVAAPQHRVKVSIRSPWLLPRLAVVDSRLTHDLPSDITASSGLDAVTQLLEAYVSRRAQPITDGMCLEGLAHARWALQRAYHRPDDAEAREAMSTASLLSGLALTNAGLGAVHGIAAPLGASYQIAHGVACAALLASVTEVNIRALARHEPDGPGLRRYAKVAEVLLGHAGATTTAALADLLTLLRELVRDLGIPRLSAYAIDPSDISLLAMQAARASSTRANPVELELAEIEEAIGQAL